MCSFDIKCSTWICIQMYFEDDTLALRNISYVMYTLFSFTQLRFKIGFVNVVLVYVNQVFLFRRLVISWTTTFLRKTKDDQSRSCRQASRPSFSAVMNQPFPLSSGLDAGVCLAFCFDRRFFSPVATGSMHRTTEVCLNAFPSTIHYFSSFCFFREVDLPIRTFSE